MPPPAVTNALSESEFAALVDELSAEAARRDELIALLHEGHPVYDQRGAAAVVRMRGWILVALGRVGLTDSALLFVLEELDSGRDPYLVAAAALGLRSYVEPVSDFAPFLVRALNNIRYHDEPVTFDRYGEYATAASDLTPIRELLATLEWLGPKAVAVLPELELLRANRGGFSKKIVAQLDRTIKAIGKVVPPPAAPADACCSFPIDFGKARSWARGFRRSCETIDSTRFEDQDGASLSFAEFFRGHPSIVVFFYTRCDNPQKCSLTIAKLARLQGLLSERGLSDRIRTAAITYDPAFDSPERIRGYGKNRSVQFGTSHRMLRPSGEITALRSHFKLGVNFVESLVNRHRIELFVLDASGAIAASFERIHWDEREIVDRAAGLLEEKEAAVSPDIVPSDPSPATATAVPILGTLASLGFALFPKCPFCWAAYLSVFGIAGLKQVPYSPWLKSVFLLLVFINIFSVWLRSRTTRRLLPFALVVAGAGLIVLARSFPGLEQTGAWCGAALTLAGSVLSAAQAGRRTVPVFFRRFAQPSGLVKNS